jgi:hypothetical protein
VAQQLNSGLGSLMIEVLDHTQLGMRMHAHIHTHTR